MTKCKADPKGSPKPSVPKGAKKNKIPEVKPRIFDFKEDGTKAMARFFRKAGFVVVRCLTEKQCDRQILSQYEHINLKTPWKVQTAIKDPADPGVLVESLEVQTADPTDPEVPVESLEVQTADPEEGLNKLVLVRRTLDIKKRLDRSKLLSELTKPNLSKEELKHLEETACFHVGFGAPCSPGSFHTKALWMIRQSPRLYILATRIIGEEELWVDYNRSIQKLPTQGDSEFLHWDIPYLHMEWTETKAIGGKVAFTPTEFICVPGTNTEKMHARIVKAYGPLYPHAKATDAKFQLDEAKPDPLKLRDSRVAIQVPRGCAIFWDAKLLHGVRANGRNNPIQFGMYLGYYGAGSREEYKKKAKIDEREDRRLSFVTGLPPELFPSFDRVHVYPFRHMNYIRMVENNAAKTRDDYPGLTTRVVGSGKRKGEEVPHFEFVADPEYTAPTLTLLGKRLAGLEKWPGEEDPSRKKKIKTSGEMMRQKV
jgi:hypothetical protein